jgi:hypothetical protein
MRIPSCFFPSSNHSCVLVSCPHTHYNASSVRGGFHPISYRPLKTNEGRFDFFPPVHPSWKRNQHQSTILSSHIPTRIRFTGLSLRQVLFHGNTNHGECERFLKNNICKNENGPTLTRNAVFSSRSTRFLVAATKLSVSDLFH